MAGRYRVRDGRSPLPDEVEGLLDVLREWVAYMRSDVAATVNALNNRLNAIIAAAGEIQPDALDPESRRELERVRHEAERATAITAGLLQRVEAAASPEAPRFEGMPGQGPRRPSHVLVVEDDAANRSVATRLLQRAGYLVTACVHGVEAMDVLDLGQVDCVVCDIRMPTLGGRGLFEQVEERYPPLADRFVFVTGDFSDPETRQFLDQTTQPVLAKPYEPVELLAAVAAVFDRARDRGEALGGV